jgi:hypothetical protein
MSQNCLGGERERHRAERINGTRTIAAKDLPPALGVDVLPVE